MNFSNKACLEGHFPRHPPTVYLAAALLHSHLSVFFQLLAGFIFNKRHVTEFNSKDTRMAVSECV